VLFNYLVFTSNFGKCGYLSAKRNILFQFEAKQEEKPEPTFVDEDLEECFNEKMKQKISIA